MKKIFIQTLSIVGIVANFLSINAQQTQPIQFTLAEAIHVAQENSPEAKAARHTFRAAYWNYRFYKANYLPSLTMNATPSMTKSINKITQPDGTNLFLKQNQLNSEVKLNINQNIWFTGGSVFVNTNLQRLDDFEHDSHAYSSSPVEIGYQQALFGYNNLKWDRRIEPVRYKESQKAYNEALELVASETSELFFGLATAQTNLDIATSNYASADTLYRYAQGRYNIGTITENEMLQLEINKLTEETNVMNARIEVEDRMQALRSFLGLSNDSELRVQPENFVPQFEVPLVQALELAYENSPEPETFKRKKLESRSNLAHAKANAGLKADLYVRFGLSQTGHELKDAYRDPMNQLYASVTVALPILDWGRGRGRIRIARSQVDLVDTQVEQGMKDFELNVSKMVRQFNLQARYVSVAFKTSNTAERRYDVAKRLYILGKSTILDLNAAIAEKDEAKRSYMMALKTYWGLYYGLRSMTGYDFERNKKIEENLPEI